MSDKKIDTGTGGINIDGKVYSYDVGVEREDASDGEWSSGDVNVDSSRRDLSKGTKVTLGQYLSNTTKGKTRSVPEQTAGGGNRYTVNVSSFYEGSTTNSDGLPRGPEYYNYQDSGAFEPLLGPQGEVLTEESANSRTTLPRPKWFTENRISRGMIRREADKKIDGNDLLRFDLTPNPDATLSIDAEHPVATYTSALVRNRWTVDSRFGNDQTVDQTSRPFAVKKYEPGRSYKPEEYYSRPDAVSQRQLASVGNILMARSSGELNANADNLDPTSSGFQVGASLVPGTAQLAVSRINESVLRARDALDKLSSDSPGLVDEQFTNITGAQTNGSTLVSWGTLNNPYDQFTGFSAFGMQVLAIGFVAAIAAVPALISFISTTGNKKPTPEDVFGRLPLGAYNRRGGSISNLSLSSLVSGLASGQSDWTELLGFSSTSFPLSDCLTTGVLAFYGLYTPEVERGGLANPLTAQSTASPEAYLVFSRAIFRSFLQITDAFKDAASAPPLEAATKIIGLIFTFGSSRIMRTINTFAQLGDTALRDTSYATLDPYSLGAGLRKSEIDKRLIDGRAAKDKSRLISRNADLTKGSANLRLAWSSFRAPDLLIMPRGLQAASTLDTELGAPSLLPSVETDEDIGIRNGDLLYAGVYASVEPEKDRIDTDVRKYIEDQLDGEYMPFYFHDVRTNEIISFHAFLTSMNDAYTAQYDSSDAFGRVEPVKTYKGTTRKVDIGFQIAALSPEDFDSMWLKINKLTTMVYPQFTAGKMVNSSNFSVTVPFSQQYAASPLTRIRIGDFIHSNYSRFNLARLFGYSYEDSSIKEGETRKSEDLYKLPGIESKKLKDKIEAAKIKEGNRFLFTGRARKFIPLNNKGEEVLFQRNTGGFPRGLGLEVARSNNEEGKPTVVRCKLVLLNDEEIGLSKSTSLSAINGGAFEATKKLAEDYLNEIKSLYGGRDLYMDVNPAELGLTSALKSEIAKELLIDTRDPLDKAKAYHQAFVNFMKPENNTIVRSFESAGGRGLPGFIESLTFDWYGGTFWDENVGRRAPQMCKVSLSFSPFHDITPGLDHKGANRAPIYPIGPHRPSRF